MLCLVDGFEAASLTEFTTKNHRKVLAGRHKFWATNQGAEEAVERATALVRFVANASGHW